MAPEKDPKKRLKLTEKELALGTNSKWVASVPPGYVSLFSAERNFGVSFKV